MNNEKKRLKIGFLNSLYAQNDKNSSWNIIGTCIAKALEKHCGEVTYLEYNLPELWFSRKLNRLAQLLLKKDYVLYYSAFTSRRCAYILNKQLAKSDFDLLVAPACWVETAFLKTDIPIVLVEDATFALLRNYYPAFSNFLPNFYNEVDMLARLALNKAEMLFFPSPWAAASAHKDYDVEEGKIRVIAWGSAMNTLPEVGSIPQKSLSKQCKLLFVGGDWERKGGAIAHETLLKLEELGIRAELTICGCVPPVSFSHPRMTVIPYLNRKDPVQNQALEALYRTSDFFLLPTRSECYGMVFCEASSFGLPSITTDTGGVAGAVTHGENGYLLSYDASGAEYAKLIATIYRDEQRYVQLVHSTYEAYTKRLNWDVWASFATKYIYAMLEQNTLPAGASSTIPIKSEE